MKFTSKELASIENTVEKLYTVTRALTASDSTDAANMRALSYIVSTLRNASQLAESSDIKVRVAGYGKATDLFARKETV